MPYYVYQVTEDCKGCEYCQNSFEIFQPISAEPLKKCPKCNNNIQRMIQPVGVKMGKKHLLTDKNVKKHGFTKLVNEGNGKFRKI